MTGLPLKTAVLALLVLLCTAFIFSNSLKDSEASHADSGIIVEIAEKIAEVIMPGNAWDWSFIVRKSAHLFEFCVLGILSALLAISNKHKCGMAVVYAFLYVVFIAFTDEFIQRFTGRSSRLTDVGIDTAGALIGFGLVCAVRWAVKRRKSKKK